MNKFTVLLLLVLCFLGNAKAQLNSISPDYPNITKDRAASVPYTGSIKMKWTLPGVLGVGVAGTFFKPYLFHVAAEGGAG